MQLRCKNKKLQNLVVPKPKILDSYKIPVANLSTKNLDVEPLTYSLHHRYIDENKHVQRNVAVELESLSINLDSTLNDHQNKAFINI